MVNTSIESPELTDAIREKTLAYTEMLFEEYERAINYAQNMQQISKQIDSKKNAQFLVTIMIGMLVQVRLNKDILAAEETAEQAIKLMESWKI